MSETLEQIALRVAEEVKGKHGDLNIQIVEFSRRLVAALGAQSYVGESDGDGTVWWKDMPPSGTQLYAAPVVNPDWQMVPKEPTPEMLNALKDGFYEEDFEQDKAFTVFDAIKAEYKAMLAAAPEYKP